MSEKKKTNIIQCTGVNYMKKITNIIFCQTVVSMQRDIVSEEMSINLLKWLPNLIMSIIINYIEDYEM